MECKAAEGYGGIYLGDGFNRNIVECKDSIALTVKKDGVVLIETLWNVKLISPSILNAASRFNRNIVECKDSLTMHWLFLIAVLIETLWNVKTMSLAVQHGLYTVLIETLWNVKDMCCWFKSKRKIASTCSKSSNVR